jgi:hypothetical protein
MHEDSLHAAAGRRAIVSPRASARHRYASPLVAAANGSARETAHRDAGAPLSYLTCFLPRPIDYCLTG